MRIRVLVDVSKPLKRSVQIHIEALKLEVTLLIQYERLPDYCYACGLIGHRFANCDKTIGDQERKIKCGWKYGDWLRATVSISRRWDPLQNSQTQRAPSFHQNIENEKTDGNRNERRGDEDVELNKVVTERDVYINETTAEGGDGNEFLTDVSEQMSNPILLEDTHMVYGTLLAMEGGDRKKRTTDLTPYVDAPPKKMKGKNTSSADTSMLNSPNLATTVVPDCRDRRAYELYMLERAEDGEPLYR
ncbi:Zinc knuckle CX2CX4HX4C [Abeliophyllum distichum]|uniref:Zinc knuckle CX2CX4HX4C n=1 Tax=Abeliophyllum distichum TaxID=126358 RepID=A0ABD1NPL3_9LAMI